MANEIQQPRQLTQKEELLPGYTRCRWVRNDRVQEIWEPRILRNRKSWKEIESLSVVERLRRCGLTEPSTLLLTTESRSYVQY